MKFKKKIPISEIKKRIKECRMEIRVIGNNFNVSMERRKDAIEMISLDDIDNIEYKILKHDNYIKIILFLRQKFDPNMSNNMVLRDIELFQFIKMVPDNYNIYAMNHMIEIGA